MELNLSTQLIQNISFLNSPHCDLRPDHTLIDMIVVHNISLPPGEFATGCVEKFFCGKLDFAQHPYFATIANLRVSAHLLISRNGQLTQFVPFNKRAWHAGESSFQGRTRCNDFSIGIELEGSDFVPFEKVQYQKLAQVIKLLMRHYPAIIRQRIVGHSDIAPQRKTDPGPFFSWDALDQELLSIE